MNPVARVQEEEQTEKNQREQDKSPNVCPERIEVPEKRLQQKHWLFYKEYGRMSKQSEEKQLTWVSDQIKKMMEWVWVKTVWRICNPLVRLIWLKWDLRMIIQLLDFWMKGSRKCKLLVFKRARTKLLARQAWNTLSRVRRLWSW